MSNLGAVLISLEILAYAAATIVAAYGVSQTGRYQPIGNLKALDITTGQVFEPSGR